MPCLRRLCGRRAVWIRRKVSRELAVLLTGLEGAMIPTSGGLSRVKDKWMYKVRGGRSSDSERCLALANRLKERASSERRGRIASVAAIEDISRLLGGCFCHAAPKVEERIFLFFWGGVKQMLIQGYAEGCLGKRVVFSN